MYKKRLYRNSVFNKDLVKFSVEYYESNLLICAKRDLSKTARDWLIYFHNQISDYIKNNPQFEKILRPVKLDKKAPAIIKAMTRACQKANVGPMATVAGTIAEYVGKKLLKLSPEIIVENGGDIFICVKRKRRVGIFAGVGSIYNNLALLLKAKDCPCGICTSSGNFGHSLSFGKSQATVVICKSAPLADGYATAIGNMVNTQKDIAAALALAKQKKEIKSYPFRAIYIFFHKRFIKNLVFLKILMILR